MSRSIWKGPFIHNDILKNLYDNKDIIYTKSRSSVITFDFIDKIFYIYNGMSYYKILINKDLIGHKLGEFSLTKKRCVFRSKKKKKKK